MTKRDFLKNQAVKQISHQAWKEYKKARNGVNVTLHRILMLKVKARARHAFTLKQKNLF